MPRDYQRSKVYASEVDWWHRNAGLFPIHDTTDDVDKEIQRIAGLLPEYPTLKTLKCLPGYGRRSACYHPRRHVIMLTKNARDELTLIHEVTHAISQDSNEPHHGKLFTKNFIRLVKIALGDDFGNELKECFKANGVEYAEA